jgi:hypothetical protein
MNVALMVFIVTYILTKICDGADGEHNGQVLACFLEAFIHIYEMVSKRLRG